MVSDLGLIARAIQWLEVGILGYFVLVNSFYFILLVSAALEMLVHLRRIRGERRWRLVDSELSPSISILAPAYNEAATISDSVRSLLSLQYPRLEVVVINDGSRDETMAVLTREFDLVAVHPVYRKRIDTQPIDALYRSRSHPNLIAVDKRNGGKADALNAGLNVASHELVCAIDADTLVETDALQRMIRPFLYGHGVLAAGGTIRVVNGSTVRRGRVVAARAPRHPLAGMQAVEYHRAFLFGRLGWNRLGGNIVISGAFGLFRRSSVLDAGGYAKDTVGEDMELVLRLRRRGYENGSAHRVDFVPDPVAWTEVPESLVMLGRQRDRWHRGLADTLWRHRRVALNPRYGALGLVVVPFFLLAELLAPAIEAIGLVGLALGLVFDVLDLSFALLFFLAAYGLGLLLSVLTLLLEAFSFRRYAGVGDALLLLLWSVLENVGLRQLGVYWRLRGLAKFLRGRTDWGVMERRGFQRGDSPPA